MTTRNEAAELFARMVFEQGYQEGVGSAFSGIGEPSGADKEKWQRAAEMINGLDDEGRACLQFLLHDAVQAALFHVLVDLDGAVVGYHEVDGKAAEFCLNLRVYENAAADSELGKVTEEIAIAPTQNGEDLHDIFLGLLDEEQSHRNK